MPQELSREPVLAKVLKFLLYSTAFIPLIIFNNYISPFHFGKVIILRSVVEVMIFLYLLLIWKDRSYLPKMTIVSWAFLLFTAAFSVTTATSVIPYASFWGSLERMGGLFTFWHYYAFFIVLTALFRTEKEWLNLFKLTIVIALISAFYGFLQRTDISWVVGSGGRERIFGTIGNPALFAGYEILSLFLSLMLFFRPGNSQNLKLFYGGSVIILTIAVFMTVVRGSIVGTGVGFLLYALIYSSAYHSKKAKKALLALVGLLVIFVMLGLMLRDTSLVQNSGFLKRVTNFDPNDFTIQTRFWAWQAGIEGWKESIKTMTLGWGPENFDIPFSKHFNPKFFRGPGSETLFDRAHNMFVEVLVTMGLFGFLTYISIFLTALKVLWKKLHEKEFVIYGIGLIPLVFAYAIHNSFIFDTSANFLVFFTILGFVSFLATKNGDQNQTPVKQSPAKVNPALFSIIAVVLMIVTIVTIYKVNVLPAKANYTSTRAIILGWDKNFSGAVAKFEEAMSYDVAGKYEIRNRFAQFILEQTASGELTPEEIDATKKAIEAVQKNIDDTKGIDYLPYLYASRLNIILGKSDPKSEYNDRALEMSLAALKLSPTFVRTYYEIAQGYLNKQDNDHAAEYFKKAADLNPDVGLSYWYWGVVEVQRGNTNFGLNILENVISSGKYTPSEGDISKLASIYAEKNDIPKLIWAYELLVKAAPTNPQYHASLAVAYAKGGRLNDAVAEAKKAAQLNPQFEPEARSFVQGIGGTW